MIFIDILYTNYYNNYYKLNKEIFMEMVKGNYVASDGKDYYNIGLNLSTGEIVMIKNASCTACAMDLACQYFGVENKMFIIFFGI